MKRILEHFETLVFYDTPQVFVATDQLRTKYICMPVEEADSAVKYLCVPVSHSRIEDIVSGKVDLRTVFEEPEIDGLYLAEPIENNLTKLSSIFVSRESILHTWLPDPGFYISIEKPSDHIVIQESVSRQRAIMHLRLNPPESEAEPKITAEHLSQGIKLIQRLVKQAYRKSLRAIDSSYKISISAPQNSELEVFSFSPGSFTIHMQSAMPVDLLGFAQISRAFEIVDSITDRIEDPDQAVDRIAEIGGHFASAYKDLLKFVTDTQTPIEYEWSMPEKKGTKRNSISVEHAKPLYMEIIKRTLSEGETVKLVGRLTKVDEKYGAWRLISDDDQKEYHGDSEIDLAGLVIETQRYEFVCEEKLEEEKGTGRELTRLFLTSFRPL